MLPLAAFEIGASAKRIELSRFLTTDFKIVGNGRGRVADIRDPRQRLRHGSGSCIRRGSGKATGHCFGAAISHVSFTLEVLLP